MAIELSVILLFHIPGTSSGDPSFFPDISNLCLLSFFFLASLEGIDFMDLFKKPIFIYLIVSIDSYF